MRRINSNYLKVLVILIGIAIIPAFRFSHEPIVLEAQQTATDTELQRAALEVLQTKCNICHEQKNPKKFFTARNMVEFAPKIYKQVFIKRRMPKGKKIKLTSEEYATLEKWLFTQDIF